MKNHTIIELHYNYKQALSNGNEVWADDWLTAIVGQKMVESINEHMPEGEGDRCYYDILYIDGTIERTYNPCRVIYKPIIL